MLMPNLVSSSRFSNVKSNAPFHSPELTGQNGGLCSTENLLWILIGLPATTPSPGKIKKFVNCKIV